MLFSQHFWDTEAFEACFRFLHVMYIRTLYLSIQPKDLPYVSRAARLT